MYDIKSKTDVEFIDDIKIKEAIEYATKNKNNKELINKVLEEAEKIKGLNYEQALLLLLCELEEENKKIFELAKKIKNLIYGKRIVLFAPLYISNYCVNGCTYCPYCYLKKTTNRIKLTQEEIEKETIELFKMGHKRIALETGEDNINCPIEYVLESIDTIYNTKYKGKPTIRRINVNIAATTIENYKKLKERNIGTYVLFQETYNKENYKKFHPFGPKSDYSYHTTAMDRALKAGIDDIGCGVLFGLSDYKYDFTALLMHKEHLEKVYNIGPHTISVPRIKPANEIDLNKFENIIDDKTFLKIIACFRIAVPYTGIIISTRETKEIREIALNLGVSQISGGSLTSVGGYYNSKKAKNSKQFETSDKRPLDEIINWLLKLEYIPSFCTACYREKRVGEKFMKLSKSMQIKNFCTPNALLTLKEYLKNFALKETKQIGENLIEKEVNKIENEEIKKNTIKFLKEIEKNEKEDIFF